LKKVALYLSLLLFFYIAALFYNLPTERVSDWLAEKAGPRLVWEKMQIEWDGLHFYQVSSPLLLNGKKGLIQELTIQPIVLSILQGKKAVDVRLDSDQIGLQSRIIENQGMIEVVWSAKVEDLQWLIRQMDNDQLPTILGVGEADGELTFDRAAMKVVSGTLESSWSQMEAYGVVLEYATVRGEIENNQMGLALSARGDVALSGKITTHLAIQEPGGSTLKGKVEVRPENPDVIQLFPKGRPVALTLLGTLSSPRWRQNAN